jgi:integral membrane protein
MTSEQRFKWTAYAEGASFLVLLGIAMPLKYLLDLPQAVRVVGMLHGVLFLLYVVLVMEALGAGRFTLRTAALAMLASVLPFGPFVFERKFGQAQQET